MNLAWNRLALYLETNPSIEHVVLWGNGQLGELIYSNLAKNFKNLKVNVIDSTITEKMTKNGKQLFPVQALVDLPCDCIVIGSIAYEKEIVEILQERYPNWNSRVFLFTSPFELTKLKKTQFSGLNELELRALVFDYPDCAEIWQALASRANKKDAQVFYECASALGIQNS